MNKFNVSLDKILTEQLFASLVVVLGSILLYSAINFIFKKSEKRLDSKLREDLNIDSLLAVQLSVLLENKYDIDITEEELGKLVTIKDVIDLLETKGVKA